MIKLKSLFGKIGRKLTLGFLILALLVTLSGYIILASLTQLYIAEDITEQTGVLIDYIKQLVFIFIFATFVIAIGLGVIISNSISRPVGKLREVAEELEKGDFAARANIKTGDELEQLGNAFDKAVAAIGAMDAEHKQLDRAKTEFLSITSHELRSPMTPMQAQLQMLKEGYFGKMNEKQKESLEIVLRNTVRLDKIIQDFLEISRIEAARLKFRFIETDLTPYIKDLVEEMSGFLPEKNIEIITRIDKLPVIEVDPDRAMQVLRNLINNAKKFSSENSKIHLRVELKGKEILFSVKDHGIGISSEEQERVFEPFFQAEKTMYRKYGGTGLGLTICKGIIQAQHGEIYVESELGKGTTFYFTVPLKPVKAIEPIKLLFSPKEDIEKRVKAIFKEILGPLGKDEFNMLKAGKKITKNGLVEYVHYLVAQGILKKESGDIFKLRINEIFGVKTEDKITTEDVVEKFVKKEGKKK